MTIKPRSEAVDKNQDQIEPNRNSYTAHPNYIKSSVRYNLINYVFPSVIIHNTPSNTSTSYLNFIFLLI